MKGSIPLTPESNLKTHQLVARRFPDHSIEICFLRAFPANRIPKIHLTGAVEGKPVCLIPVDREVLDRGRNPAGRSLAGLNTTQFTWIVTFDWDVAQAFEKQGGYTVMGVELLVRGGRYRVCSV